MEESYSIAEELNGTPARRIRRRLCRAKRSLHGAWEDSQLVSFCQRWHSICQHSHGCRRGLEQSTENFTCSGTKLYGWAPAQKGTELTPSPGMPIASP